MSAVESKVKPHMYWQTTLKNAFIEYLKDRHDLLMYNHQFMFGLKHLDPTEIAMQIQNSRSSSIYFCDLTFYLLMDSLSLCGTIFTLLESMLSFRFEDLNTMDVKDSDIVCVVANKKVHILDFNLIQLQTCPLNDFLTHRYSAAVYIPDIYEVPRTHIIGLHDAGEFTVMATRPWCNNSIPVKSNLIPNNYFLLNMPFADLPLISTTPLPDTAMYAELSVQTRQSIRVWSEGTLEEVREYST